MSERKTIYLCLAHMSEEGWEQKYVKEAFDTNWVVPMGPNVNAFENDLADFANSLTPSLPSREGGTSPQTFCASSHPITYCGAKPVFIGSEKDTWNMDPELLEQAILDRKARTGRYPKAIVPVALYGMPYRIDRIMAIADRYGIPVIEDAA